MGWFRKHLRHGTWLALLALALQFGLSFGHVHAAAPTRTAIVAGQLSGSAAPTAASVTGLISAAIDAEYGALTLAPSDQSDHPPGQTSPDDCAICAVLALANAVLFAQPPVLLLPDAIGFLHRTTDAGLIHLDPSQSAFQPRAPPAS